MLLAIFGTDKDSDKEKLKGYLLNFLEAGAIKLSKPLPKKMPSSLRWFTTINIRFQDPEAGRVDYSVTQGDQSIEFVGKTGADSRVPAGYVFDLDRLLKLSERIPPERSIALACRFEILKNKRKKRPKDYMEAVFNRDIIVSLYALGAFFISPIIKGSLSLFYDRIKSMFYSGKSPEAL